MWSPPVLNLFRAVELHSRILAFLVGVDKPAAHWGTPAGLLKLLVAKRFWVAVKFSCMNKDQDDALVDQAEGDILARYRESILRIARSHGARNVRIFGSYSRGEQTASSDLDLLVTLDPHRSLLDLIAIRQDLQDELGIEIDVVTDDSLSPYIRESDIERDPASMKNDRLYLFHIRDAIEKIESYISVGRDRFLSESHWHDAAIRQLEIVGEATKNVSMTLRDKYPEVPWRRIAGLRDVLIHNYMGVDLDAVWEITQASLPALKENINRILDEV